MESLKYPALHPYMLQHRWLVRLIAQVTFADLPIALVSSLLALRIENLNFALTSDLLHETRRRYSDR